MSNKQFNARMQQKIDTYENWAKATNFIPLKGELIIYTTDEKGNKKIGFKVGTGDETKNVHQLDFISFSEAAAIADGVVRYDLNQEITEEQKVIARNNIGAGSSSVQFITWVEENNGTISYWN